MKIEEIYYPDLDQTIVYYIGQCYQDNDKILQCCGPDDLLFQSKDYCTGVYVVATVKPSTTKIARQSLKQLVWHVLISGSKFCKQNSLDLTNCKNLHIVVRKIKFNNRVDYSSRIEFSSQKIVVV